MRFLFVMLCLNCCVLALHDGRAPASSGRCSAPVSAVWEDSRYAPWVVYDYLLPEEALGLDIYINSLDDQYVISPDNASGCLRTWLYGSMVSSQPLSDDNSACFGVAFNHASDTDSYLTDDWYRSDLFYNEGWTGVWTKEPNPVGTSGRGMDFDGTDYWITNGAGSVCRFQPGVGAEIIEVPMPTWAENEQLSGLAIAPYKGDLILTLTMYHRDCILLYNWDGASLSFITGYAAPERMDVRYSYGLCAFSVPEYDKMDYYWAYLDYANNYHMAHLFVWMEDSEALSSTTWGNIKSIF